MTVSKVYRSGGQTLLPVIMFNYYICLYNNVCEWNGNKICLKYAALPPRCGSLNCSCQSRRRSGSIEVPEWWSRRGLADGIGVLGRPSPAKIFIFLAHLCSCANHSSYSVVFRRTRCRLPFRLYFPRPPLSRCATTPTLCSSTFKVGIAADPSRYQNDGLGEG